MNIVIIFNSPHDMLALTVKTRKIRVGVFKTALNQGLSPQENSAETLVLLAEDLRTEFWDVLL